MNPFFTKKMILLVSACLLQMNIWAQQQTPLDIALRYMEQEHAKWQLDKTDVANPLVSRQYRTRHNGVTHFYFLQQHEGIPVHNAVLGIHVAANGKVGFATSRFLPQLATRVNARAPLLTPLQAIIYAAQQLDLPGKAAPTYLSTTDRNELLYEDKNISRSPIRVRLMYQPASEGAVRLAWDLAIQQTNTPDYWSVRVDALTGTLLDKNNWTLYCKFDHEANHRHSENCVENAQPMSFVETRQALLQRQFSPPVDNARYNVFPVPVESPLHGQRQLLVSPADELASPYGWHDVNGVVGAEYRITRGNNVHAFLDLNDRDVSAGNEPSGGTELVFDFPFDPRQEPIGLRDASVTQLFYMNNFMHDFTYQYGFDEAAGNFQRNNYGRGGSAEDPVLAQSQDGGGTNNANFSTPPDGISGSMQMYLWSSPPELIFSVNSPSDIARTYPVGGAGFGLQYSETPITGRVVAALDSSQSPSLVCRPLANSSAVSGNIALIDRGTCLFVEKARNVQAAGASGIIVCNNENATILMGGTAVDITIPLVSLSSGNCALIKEKLRKNEEVQATIAYSERPVPAVLDASFDNGIVAHEYGHGISIRLTGGPENSNCLNNNEQMGEGWSDFFTLVTSVKPDDVGTTGRGIGTYVSDRNVNARGIRRQRYSTDMSINTQVFDDIIGTTAPHPLGEVWTSVLWDLYWKMVEVYGFDDDLYRGKGGNNLAIQLVMDGMKLQACEPGFIDGRDAILAADILNNEGANQCFIWEVFARRGLGWSADQGDTDNRNDGKQAFDLAPDCSRQLLITKNTTPLIKAGDTISVAIEIANYKDSTATQITITDQLPVGTAYLAGSANAPATVENGTVQFKLDQLPSGESKILTYKISTPLNNFSKRQFLDDMENGGTNWQTDTLAGTDVWRINVLKVFSGRRAWYIPATIRRNDQLLRLKNPLTVTGVQPTLRFYHTYDTNPGLDGGIVQISNDGGTTWRNVDSLLFRNGYRGRVAAATFGAAQLQAFWGKRDDFFDSYLDLRPFIGQQILVRFRFGTQVKETSRGTGWWLDDIEMFDLFNYQSEVCAVTPAGDRVCALAASRGTFVQPQSTTTDTDEPQTLPLQIDLYPNPAKDLVNVAITAQKAEEATLRIFSTDGRLLMQHTQDLIPGNQIVPVRINQLYDGLYLVEIKTQDEVVTQKMVVAK